MGTEVNEPRRLESKLLPWVLGTTLGIWFGDYVSRPATAAVEYINNDSLPDIVITHRLDGPTYFYSTTDASGTVKWQQAGAPYRPRH